MQTALPMPPSKVSLKLYIHKNSNQVLFAETGEEFVEFFFNILRLPVGTLTTFLKPDIMFGHLGNMRESIINLSPSFGRRMSSEMIHFSPNGVKEGLYLVKNDLEVKPLSTASLLTLFNEFDVKDGDLEENFHHSLWFEAAQGYSPVEKCSDRCIPPDGETGSLD